MYVSVCVCTRVYVSVCVCTYGLKGINVLLFPLYLSIFLLKGA